MQPILWGQFCYGAWNTLTTFSPLLILKVFLSISFKISPSPSSKSTLLFSHFFMWKPYSSTSSSISNVLGIFWELWDRLRAMNSQVYVDWEGLCCGNIIICILHILLTDSGINILIGNSIHIFYSPSTLQLNILLQLFYCYSLSSTIWTCVQLVCTHQMEAQNPIAFPFIN